MGTRVFFAENVSKDCVGNAEQLTRPCLALLFNLCRPKSGTQKTLLCLMSLSDPAMLVVTTVRLLWKRLMGARMFGAAVETTFVTFGSVIMGHNPVMLQLCQPPAPPLWRQKRVPTRWRKAHVCTSGEGATACWTGPASAICVARPSAASRAPAPSAACACARFVWRLKISVKVKL